MLCFKNALCIVLGLQFAAPALASDMESLGDSGVRLVQSAVCDPPVLHSDDPLGLRAENAVAHVNEVPSAFVVGLHFTIADKKLMKGSISGSIDEEFVPVSVSINEVLMSAPSPKLVHAVRLYRVASDIMADLFLVDNFKLTTKCYATGDTLF